MLLCDYLFFGAVADLYLFWRASLFLACSFYLSVLVPLGGFAVAAYGDWAKAASAAAAAAAALDTFFLLRLLERTLDEGGLASSSESDDSAYSGFLAPILRGLYLRSFFAAVSAKAAAAAVAATCCCDLVDFVAAWVGWAEGLVFAVSCFCCLLAMFAMWLVILKVVFIIHSYIYNAT